MTVPITYNNRIAETLKELGIFQETTAKLKKSCRTNGLAICGLGLIKCPDFAGDCDQYI